LIIKTIYRVEIISEKRACSLLFLTVTQPRNLKYLNPIVPINSQQLKKPQLLLEALNHFRSLVTAGMNGRLIGLDNAISDG